MPTLDLRALISKLNAYSRRATESALGMCVSRHHYEVSVEHFLLQCLEDEQSDISQLLRHYEIDIANLKRSISHVVEKAPSDNKGKPVFSRLFVELMETAWLTASVETGQSELRSG
ncbi:MAG: type VI secretion system ATPase TssH, partial [Gammaproteobacteria bacterium]|nr:type VI secretion system ATPase TssH [Gammaproteobacteria bacterium]